MKDSHEFKRLGRSVAQIALPVLVEQFFIVIMGVVNTMLAANLGKEAISSIGMIDTISIIIISVFSALSIGGTVVVAQYIGHNDPEKANQAGAQALMSCLAISVVVTLGVLIFQKPLVLALFGQAEAKVLENSLTYLSISLWSYIPIAMVTIGFGILRGSGNTRTPMLISIIMNFFNVIFSFVLIYGINLGFIQTPAYGVAGAAGGLTAARIFGAFIVLATLLRGSRLIRINRWRYFRFAPDLQKCIFNLGVPASAEQLMFNGGKLIVQTFIVQLGTVSIAANSIVNSVTSLQMIPGMALAAAAPVIVGQLIGRGEPLEAQKQLKFLILLSMAANGVLSLVMFPFVHGFLGLYTQDSQTIEMAFGVMVFNLILYPIIWPSAFVAPSGIRGAGDVRFTMIVSIVSMWLLRILLGYIFAVVLPFGIIGVWMGMYADWVGRGIFFIRRLLGSKWLKRPIFARDENECINS